MIRRHSLVWLSEAPEGPETAAAWQEAGNPFIVCRTRPEETLSLGFCLPSASGAPARVAARSNLSHIVETSRPPLLGEVAAKLSMPVPPALLKPLEGATIRLIGSRMWEAITGTRYTTGTSDLDLVVDLSAPGVADEVCSLLAHIDCPVRIDAELSFAGKGEVHWKEWGRDPLLVKSLHAVGVKPQSWIFELEQSRSAPEGE